MKLSSMPMFSLRKDCNCWTASAENSGGGSGKLAPLFAPKSPTFAALPPSVLVTGGIDWTSLSWVSEATHGTLTTGCISPVVELIAVSTEPCCLLLHYGRKPCCFL